MTSRRSVTAAIQLVSLIVLFAGFIPEASAQNCYYKYDSVCYETLEAAEAKMRFESHSAQLLQYHYEDDTYIYYHLPTEPELPSTSYRAMYLWKYQNPSYGPLFPTRADAEAWMREKAAQPSRRYPTQILSDSLVYRGERVYSGALKEYYYSHSFASVPISFQDVTDGTWLAYCSDYTAGVETAKINYKKHFVYSTDANSPYTLLPNHVVLFHNNCRVGGTWYRIQSLHSINVQEVTGYTCNNDYTNTNNECVGNLTDQIEKVPEYYLEPTLACTVGTGNESNPCNPANGTKTQVERDYSTLAQGGLTFDRYYASKGTYRSASSKVLGWRHTYSRSLNEQPDKGPLIGFAHSSERSNSYSTASAACTSGWGDIKDDVWGGDLSAATATFSGGNTCTISSGGVTQAHFVVRSSTPRNSFTPASTVKVITRPNGTSYRFVQSGSDWVNELDASVTLVASGGNWIFTDRNDTQETYNSAGQLISITERNGRTQTLTYDLSVAQGGDGDSETLDKVTGEFGHVLTFTYDNNGRLGTVTTPDGDIDYSYDLNRNLIKVTYPDNSEKSYIYDDYDLPNFLTGIIDEKGDRFATWEYDDDARAVVSEHAGGKERVEFTYNTDGTTTIDLANGASRTYTFGVEQGRRVVTDLSGDVCSSCPGGDIDSRTYDSNGYLDEATDWQGNITKTARNSEGLVTTLTEGKGSTEQRVTTYTWHSTYRIPTQISRPNHDIDYTYDSNGNATEVEITDGTKTRTWTMTYNSDGQVLTVDGPISGVGDTTTYDYYTCSTGDECGQLESITDAEGNVTDFDSYDASGRVTQITDPNGLETDFTYDDRGNLTTITQIPTVGTSRTTSMTYDETGLLESVTFPSGQSLTYAYDAAHYLTSITDSFDNSIDYTYDSMGNVTDEDLYDPTDTLATAVDYVYDLNSRLETISEAGLYDTDLTYDDVGNLTDVTDPKLNWTQHNYDALNRLEQTIDPLNRYTDLTYDDHDNVTQVSAPNGADTDYTYDNLDNLTEEDSPDRGVVTYTHDAAGNVATMTDARNKVTEYTYDDLYRVTEIELHNNDLITFQYDTGTNAKGKLNKITDPSGETSWEFNQFGQVTKKTQKIGTISLVTEFDYDINGRLVTMTYPSGMEVDYTYDDQLPDSVTADTTTILQDATYEPFGPVNGWDWGNTTVNSRSYDARGLLTSQKMITDTRTITYDSNGRLITLDDARHDLGLDYDALNRLDDFDAAGSSSLPSQDFTYDANGNRKSITQNSTTYNYTITTNTNRLASTQGPTARTMTYDASGNITGDGVNTYVYDDRGRLESVNSGAVTYEYNGQGQRVKKDDGTNETLFVYDEAGNLIGEYDDTGGLIQEHIWFAGAPVAVTDGNYYNYVHTDHLGTPRIVSDGNTAIWRWESGPFGEEGPDEDVDGDSTDFTYNLRFPGQYYDDEAGFHYNYYRTYDPSTGRYLESDPIGLGGGLNTYGYVSANPLSSTDPFGLYEGGGVAEVLGDPSAQAAARARAAAAQQRRAQKEFEEYQRLCRLYGGANCDAPQDCPTDEASVEAWRTFIDIFSLSSGVYGTSRIPGSRLTVRPNVPYEPRWNYGTGKSAEKWARQMQQRGWTESQISEALSQGQAHTARNNINPANGATRYVHPETGRSVVIDNTTRELIHVGGDGYRY